MSLRALLVPVNGQPVVLKDKHWGPTSLNLVLGSADHRTLPASWSPSENFWLYVVAAGDSTEHVNRVGRTMVGPVEPPLRGPLLILALTRDQRVASLEPEDLLTIALRLLIAESSVGELGSGQ